MTGGRSFCRLTVLAPRSRVDVALPVDVPVAELVPMLLELVGEPAGAGWRPVPWRLTGTVGGALPAAATLADLGMPDGETLRLAPASVPPPPPVFDDPIDALAASAGEAGSGDRRFGACALFAVAVAAAALLAAPGPGSAAAAAIAGVTAAAAVWTAGRLAWKATAGGREFAAHSHAAAVTSGLVAVPLAAAAGWTALPAPPGPGPLLLAVGAAGTVAAIAQVAVRVVSPALIGLVAAALLVGAAALGLRLGSSPQAAAAAAGGLALVLGPMLPRAAIRLAGLPRPVVPGHGSGLDDDGTGGLSPEELAERADLARGYLAGLVGASALVAAAGAVLAAALDMVAGAGSARWLGAAFAGVTVVALGLRSRSYADPVPARTSMVAAIGGGVALAGLAGIEGSADAALLAGTGLLAVAAVGLLALGRTTSVMSPVTGRAIDLVEGLFVVAAIPLALGAMDVYRIVRGL